MIITYKNRELIKHDNIKYDHDAKFRGLCYDYLEKSIQIKVNNLYYKKTLYLNFYNVIFFDVKNCEFWEKYDEISCFYIEENQTKLEELKNEYISNYESYKFSSFDINVDFFTFGIEIKSGDYVTIICEKIEYEEKDLIEDSKAD